MSRQSGFALLEFAFVIILGAAIAATVSLTLRTQNDPRFDTARIMCCRIAASLERYERDMGRYVGSFPPARLPDLTLSDSGTVPAFPSEQPLEAESLLGLLRVGPERPDPRWRGPYLDFHVPPDPWGRRYVISCPIIMGSSRLWVVSAGPDGMLDTQGLSRQAEGDDVAIRVR